MSSFSSLNVGSLAIHAAQRGLDVTGQNISNSATTGYSRQRVDQVAVGGPTVPAVWSRYDETGGGVKVTGVSRLRDEFLEARARTAHSNLAETQKLEQTYAAVERTFDEPSTTGLQTKLADFWNAWGKISNDPKAEAPRNLAYEKAVTVSNHLNHMSTQLQTQWTDSLTELTANVTDVNVMAKDIAKLNRAIRNNTISGLPANELADQRDLLVEKVSNLTGAVAKADEDGQMNVVIGGQYLVKGVENAAVKVEIPGGAGPRDAVPPVSIQWAASGDPEYRTASGGITNAGAVAIAVNAADAAGSRGEISGQLKTLNDVVPASLTDLDTVAKSLADTVNAQQAQGYTVNNTTPGVKAGDLFAISAGTDFTAENIRLAAGTTPTSLAVSSGDPAGTPSVLDGDNANDMAKHLSDVGGADARYRSLVVELGVQAQSIGRASVTQAVVAGDADDARENVSGVSLNEEMTNLIKYQHSFTAAAKFITTVDSTIEALLNMVR